MFELYNPTHWYWRADDGRLYSSLAQALVGDTDPDYLAWKDAATPTRWPENDDGAQTDAALEAVLSVHGLTLWPVSLRDQLLAYAADKRGRVETGGIVVNGAAIDTSRDSQAMISGAFAYSQANPDKLIKFKAASGWTTLDAATVAAIATAVGDHVQACFAAEEEVAAAIEAGAITSIEEIDAADWPFSQ